MPPSVTLDLDGQPLKKMGAGGQQVTLQSIHFRGNTLFTEAELTAVLGETIHQPQDMAGLQALANRISRFYRDNGYPFARALLPAQDLGNGALTLEVVEGRYGRVHTTGPELLAAQAQPWLTALQTGAVIESAPLERQLLVLGDQPGIAVTPVMRPGQEVGTGELDVQVQATERVNGFVGADNHGGRYSGEQRVRVGLSANRLLRLGDELSVVALYASEISTLYPDEKTWFGELRYTLPIGYRGLRGEFGYVHTDYTLGRGFEGYTGTADSYFAGLSYPLLRRQRHNLALSGGYRYRDLDDNVDFIDYRAATESHSVPMGLLFDRRDGLGGITWGGVTLTPGEIDLSRSGAEDTRYQFTKLELDVSRLQSLGASLQFFARFNGQWADRAHLDGSESFYLGGPNGVRAYPVGEGSDARGWLTQFELRYRVDNSLAPYIFFDAGRTLNGGIDESDAREVAGGGIGIRYQQGGFSFNLASAWQTDGGDAQSDDHQREPRIWANMSHRF
ncbi:ShlB/FhaC/HecB family hemolysin secretion/activation protein [Vreelandella sp. H-I2]